MALETHGSGSILTEEYDGRQLEMQAVFDIGGVTELDPQGPEWEAQKLAFGRQVAIQVADQVVPEILAQLGIPVITPVPECSWKANSNLDHHAGFASVQDGLFETRQQISGVFRLTGDRVMEAEELIYAARDSIAEQVANVAVFTLEQRFENKQRASYSSSLQRRNGEVSYERTLKPQGTGKDADMVA